ncbi:hypothetical protein RIF29_38386 [Crotalaria pallida]|uniref:F-box domain-containing protein n=1 Tax=Crotalaria pallida TaxID=3830 RepID=A0AAN9E127_CROPI
MEKKIRVEIGNIPEELIIQILMRLPVKSLFRFKCVSKLYLSLITDPNFALSHLKLSPARLLYLPRNAYASQTLSIDLEEDASLPHAPLNPSFLTPNSFCDIKGSCRGFLLLRHSIKHLYLWNPSTNVHKPIPSLLRHERETDFYVFGRPIFYGFCYDPLKDDYLVVVAYFHVRSYFSLRANAWCQIDEEDAHVMSGGSRTGTLFNDIIHWLALRDDVGVRVILSFDPIQRSFSEVVPLPADFNQDHRACNLCVLGGFLGLYVAENNATRIWIMKEYKEQSSWTMSTVVAFDNLPTKSLSPICTTKSGDIVGKDCDTGLVRFNVEGKLLEHVSYSNDPHGCNAATYRESLFSLPC